MQSPLTLAEINALDQAQFVAHFGAVFEHAPWVAAAAWQRRPFADLDALHRAMVEVVAAAPPAQQEALIRAHPDLAGTAALAGEVTSASAREQAGAGLNALTPAEYARFTQLNRAYHERFGFPFIICVREHTKASILAAFAARLHHDRPTEIAIALTEIAKIARLRLQDLIAPAPPA
ncbi:2-oxo-4-hydroxy-4-carboxy-5-ureidoimidazoline decarboxylase [Kallotenue papyrolyticum]|uniref:2-oxo-4-hydroxy-4-carboxy-5-ureidoimidazoline decarboxylase n=1 Tax=Kallotenue papyrolyticum TaxID=1325125 RepID=UPI0004702C94|nr:2-oxo-4-hydroxy-4-carboxy-5-ureidoimidazoline decarboxylase [Kallotenue papyrolyticum]